MSNNYFDSLITSNYTFLIFIIEFDLDRVPFQAGALIYIPNRIRVAHP